jgi:hypothetical protein
VLKELAHAARATRPFFFMPPPATRVVVPILERRRAQLR